MARQARQYGESDTYHVMLRGINRQNIFEEGEDFAMFLGMLADVKELSGILLYGYCLMGNHAHLLLRAADEDLIRY